MGTLLAVVAIIALIVFSKKSDSRNGKSGGGHSFGSRKSFTDYGSSGGHTSLDNDSPFKFDL